MGQKTYTVTTDDIDGTEGAETVPFVFEFESFEIDLNEANRKQFEKDRAEARRLMERYVKAGRRLGHAKRGTRGRATGRAERTSQVQDSREVREWARSHGVTVSVRGAIPRAVRAAWVAKDPTALPGYVAPEEPTPAPAKRASKAPAQKAAQKGAKAGQTPRKRQTGQKRPAAKKAVSGAQSAAPAAAFQEADK